MLTNTAYELLALGMRYVFLLLLLLLLLRAAFLMRKEQRSYRRTLRQLPDAGLVGEVVDLDTGKGYPLPREGMLGSGRSCDVRLLGLRRREVEFVFRQGLGLRLIPIHQKHHGLLDGEALGRKPAYALHGTVLEIRGLRLRFRLFAGLDMPKREVTVSYQNAALSGVHQAAEDMPLLDIPTILPPAAPPAQANDWAMTWQHAPLPGNQQHVPPDPALLQSDGIVEAQQDLEEEDYQVPLLLRRRRKRQERKKQDEG